MKYFKRPEVQIPLSFLIIGTLWIVVTDHFFLAIEKNIASRDLTQIQTLKGGFFVVFVAFLIHFMIKSSNKRYRQSQEEYKDLFYNTPNPMLVLDIQTNRFRSVNKAALDIYGYSVEEFKQMCVEDVRGEVVAGKRNFNREASNIYKHKKKNNDTIICTELTRNISFKNSPASLLSINDITELEKAKSELIARENQLQQVLNSITDGFFILTPSLVIEKANDFFKRMVEVPLKNIEGQMFLDLFPSIKESEAHQQYLHAIETHSPVHFENYYNILNKWYDVSAYPFDGGLSVFFRDITKEKEDQLQRDQNEQNLLALINNTEDLMWSVDCDFKYFIFNEPYRKNYKRAFGEELYVGKCALNEKQGVEHMKKWKSFYERALKGEKFTIDMDFVIDNNSYFTTIRLNPICDVDGHIIGAGCFLQDITERKLHLRKIEQQNEQLKQIAFITSHKVRVPLANILGLTEILDEEDPLNPSNYKVIEHIKTSAKQLDTSIKNMVQQTVHAND